MNTNRRFVDESTARRLAVEADVDTRTIKKLLKGEAVRGLASHRAIAALVKAGFVDAERAQKLTEAGIKLSAEIAAKAVKARKTAVR